MNKLFVLLLTFVSFFPASAQAQQSYRKVEALANIGGGKGLGEHGVSHYQFDIAGGYRFSDCFSTGIGINHMTFLNRTDLPSGIDDILVQTGRHRAWRPYIYGKYAFSPQKTVGPFIRARLGYGAYSDGFISFGRKVDADQTGFSWDKFSDIPNQQLELKGGVFSSIEAGLSFRLGQKGTHCYLSVSYGFQPTTYVYLSQQERKYNNTLGLHLGIGL